MSGLSNNLKILLGTESAGKWFEFMSKVGDELPFLLTRGRPTKVEIAMSEIGRSGCTSWSEYIENELSWNVSTWRAWQRAYSIVVKYPYLRDLELSASAINTLNTKADVFPLDINAYKLARAGLSAHNEKAKAESIGALKKRVSGLKGEVKALEGRINTHNGKSWFFRLFSKV